MSIFDNPETIRKIVSGLQAMKQGLLDASRRVVGLDGKPVLGGANIDRDLLTLQNMIMISLLEMIAANTNDLLVCLANVEHQVIQILADMQEGD
jgi:hypothetical protein